MNGRNALARLSDVASREVLPFAARLRGALRRTSDQLSQKLLGDDFEERARHVRERYRSSGGDPFGLDPETAKRAVMVCSFFHRMYFRTQSDGLEHVPEGRALIVSNHSGQIPFDAAIIACSMFLDRTPPRLVRAMVDRWAFTLPFVSTFFSRVGQVVGVPENARRLLDMDELLLVFPEGISAVNKPFARRYQLDEFGLGFMRLAIETETPIVPVAVIGAEEQYVNIGNFTWAARALNLPAFPVIPQLLLPGGQLPLPTKYRLIFGEPLRFSGDPNDEDAVVADKVWVVRQTVQSLLNQGLSERKSVFY
jgi:1-acyl-sn-glycerol-3-phosphate acyltransferase